MSKFATIFGSNATATPVAASVQQPVANPQPAASAQPTAAQPAPAEYKFDPSDAAKQILDRINGGALTQRIETVGDQTYLLVSGNEDSTKALRGKFKGLGGKWSPDFNGWLLSPTALTDPTSAAAAKDARIAERNQRKAAKDAAKAETSTTSPTKAETAATAPKQKPATNKTANAANTISLKEAKNKCANALKAACPFLTPDALKAIVVKFYGE